MKRNHIILISIIVVLLVLLAVSYKEGWLNKVLPKSWQHTKSTFVGAYGRTPHMQQCMVFSDPSNKWPCFNRCAYA